jgi:hypothetical protein
MAFEVPGTSCVATQQACISRGSSAPATLMSPASLWVTTERGPGSGWAVVRVLQSENLCRCRLLQLQPRAREPGGGGHRAAGGAGHRVSHRVSRLQNLLKEKPPPSQGAPGL